MKRVSQPLPAEQVTRGPQHHFFSYYDKQQWDASGRYLLCLETQFMDRMPRRGDTAQIGMIDTSEGAGAFIPLSTTRAWCWQQGCMLQWLPGAEETIIYNDLIADRFVSIIQNVRTGARKVLPRPIYTVSPNGNEALSLNFSRLAETRPGYGYEGLTDLWSNELSPSEDGVFLVNLETGEHELIVSLAQLAANDRDESMIGQKHWVNHLLFNPSGDRFIFLHRWPHGKGRFTRMYTADKSGQTLHRVPVTGASHFIWYDETHFTVWARSERFGNAYHHCTDQSDEINVIGEGLLTRDGHVTYSPDRSWLLTDEYPDKEHKRPLILYRLEDGVRIDIGSYYSPPDVTAEIRCDLHPRWNQDGTKICIDSVHEGSRQMYVVDVRSLVQG